MGKAQTATAPETGAHTPGPWRVDFNGNAIDVCGPTHRIAELWLHDDRAQDKANAILISAAPDLLEALEGLYGTCPPALLKKWPNITALVRAAIAKAGAS